MVTQYFRVYIIISSNDPSSKWANLIYSFGVAFFVLWSLYLGITIKIQDQHLSAVDIKNEIWVAYKYREELEPINTPVKVKKNVDFPGHIDEEQLDEINNIDYKEIIH